MNVTEDDKEHIRRLKALRESGGYNMFTEVKRGLYDVFPEDQAKSTYQWVTDHMDYYMSGEWTDEDV